MMPDTSCGASHVPSELNACENVRRKCERSGGPSAAASGFATTCRIVMPLAMTNSATSTSEYVSKCVAAGTIRQPSTMTPSAKMMDLLLPSRAISAAAGNDTMKYAMKNANCVSIACAYVSSKIALSAAISGSMETVMNPHMKNSVVTVAKPARMPV